jgi:hypothetical protein
MKKFWLFIPLILISAQLSAQSAPRLDVVSFMVPNYHVGTMTPLNSFLAITIHIKTDSGWDVYTEGQPYTPAANEQVLSTDWRVRSQARQMAPGIIYQSKTYFPGKSDEIFRYDPILIVDTREPYALNVSDFRDPAVYGLYRTFQSTLNGKRRSDLVWSSRYYPAAPITITDVKTFNYRNNIFQQEERGPVKVVLTLQYLPAYNPGGNLPISPTIVNVQNWVDMAGNIGQESYYYSLHYGLTRYERRDNGILTNYNTYNYIMPYPAGENPDSFFRPK